MTINKHLKPLLTVISVLSFFEVLLLVLAFHADFEIDTGYFQRGSVLPYVILAIDVIICIAALMPIFVNNKYPTESDSPSLTRTQANVYAILGTIAILLGTLGICLNTEIGINNTIRLFLGIGLTGLGVFFLPISYKDGYKYIRMKILDLVISLAIPLGVMFEGRSNFYRAFNSVENTAATIIAVSFIIYILNEGNRLSEASKHSCRATANLLHVHLGATFPVAYIVAYITGAVDDKAILTIMLIFLLTSLFALASTLKMLTPEQVNSEYGECIIETSAANETNDNQGTEDTVQPEE